jgi:hypothetical protein
MQKLTVVEKLFCSSNLFRLTFFLEVALGKFERRLDNVPILEDGDAGLFGFEELSHQPNQIKAINDPFK